jgi:hypothetical protein
MQEAKGHGRAFIQSTIGNHPMASALVIAVLVVLIVVLVYYVHYYKTVHKSGFRVGISPYNNLNMNGNNPMWQVGSMDAGDWGPVHRDATSYNMAAYIPSWRGNAYRGRDAPAGYREGLDATGAPDPSADPTMAPVTAPVAMPASHPMRRHRGSGGGVSPFPQVGPAQQCGGWDPSASLEAQALTSTGALPYAPIAEGRFQNVVQGSSDSGLDDTQLEMLMHEGGTP